MKEGVFFAGKQSAGNFCPHVGCNFSCGYSIDAIPGKTGECMNEKREVPEDLPVTTVVE